MELTGQVTAGQVATTKFQIGGRLAAVRCQPGGTVTKGQLLAALDRTELQAYLDRALKQYDLERAEFDEKQKQNPAEYDRRRAQDALDITVKNVEIAKANLDATQLDAPIGGVVVAMDNLPAGTNITPAGFVISLVDPTGLFFQAALPQQSLTKVKVGQKVKVSLRAFPGQTWAAKVTRVAFAAAKDNTFAVDIVFDKLPADLRLGLTGKAILSGGK